MVKRRPKRVIDLTGQVFGDLIVENRHSYDKYQRMMWTCRCACGSSKVITSNALRRGRTKSCGCRRKGPAHNRKDLTGKKFGRLVAQRLIKNCSKTTPIVWECVCDCGNVATVSPLKLSRGHTKSCGCWKRDFQRQPGRPLGSGRWGLMIRAQGFCLKCDATTKLEAHHIYPDSTHPKLRVDLSNGAALCSRCHDLIHSRYKLKDLDARALAEFLDLGELETEAVNLYAGWRERGVEDLRKAIHTIELLIDSLEK